MASPSSAQAVAPTRGEAILVREAVAADMPGIAHVRTSVRENLLTREQLDRLGITNDSVAASLLTHRRGWVAVHAGEVVAFSMADRTDYSIFALFVLPEFEGRGLGGRLLDAALAWQWEQGAERVWLSTGPGTRAQAFYERRGWLPAGVGPRSDIRFELARPLHAREASP